MRRPKGVPLRDAASVNGAQKKSAFSARKRYFASPASLFCILFSDKPEKSMPPEAYAPPVQRNAARGAAVTAHRITPRHRRKKYAAGGRAVFRQDRKKRACGASLRCRRHPAWPAFRAIFLRAVICPALSAYAFSESRGGAAAPKGRWSPADGTEPGGGPLNTERMIV